ncbi:MAG: response regulator [Acidobacteriaceae bacterium]
MSEQNVVDTSSYESAEEYGGDYGNADFESSESGEANDGGQPGPGMGQSKSSRRRRRKRKNKVAGEGQAVGGGESDMSSPATPMVMEGESLALAASAAPKQARRPQPGGQQANGQPQGSQQQGQGGKRWKKKFRDRDRRSGGGGSGRSENPGNDFRAEAGSSNGGGYGGGNGYRPDNFGNQAGGFKRKGKGGGQPRERGFVGPMDHSYRAGGEFGDAPPSTIQLPGQGRRSGHRHTGDSQPIDRSMPRPIPIPEGAQTHIYFFIEELFFQAKIQETAKKLGVKVSFVKNDKEALAVMMDGEENKPALIVFDLNNANAKPLTLIPKLKTKLKRSASIVGFLSHLQGDLKAKAVEAGCDVVMPRAAFSQNLPNLLRRYGVEEEEEINFNC